MYDSDTACLAWFESEGGCESPTFDFNKVDKDDEKKEAI